MTDNVDVAIIGAGPAGMAAAIEARAHGKSVAILDDQPAPGGQVWRAVEAVDARGDLAIFGEDCREGVAATARFRAAEVDYRPLSRVIGVEDPSAETKQVLYLRDGEARRLSARRIIVATGAYERPTPFPGWTLPGVMTLGAAQIALKTSAVVPAAPFAVAGQGPLLLLLLAQLRAAGATPDLVLRLDRRVGLAAAKRLPAALRTRPGDLLKGLKWSAALPASMKGVVEIEAVGRERLQAVRWRARSGMEGERKVNALLVHDGVIPNAQLTRSMRAPHAYSSATAEWRPVIGEDGALENMSGVFAAGDCAGVGGWSAAALRGAIAGRAAADAPPEAGLARALERALGARPLLDALYPPAAAFEDVADDTIVCRCEEATAGDIRAAAALGVQGPNQMKAFSRAGMGPCQGRMCAYAVNQILAKAQGRAPEDVGLYRLRMPISPVPVKAMAALNETPMDLPRS